VVVAGAGLEIAVHAEIAVAFRLVPSVERGLYGLVERPGQSCHWLRRRC